MFAKTTKRSSAAHGDGVNSVPSIIGAEMVIHGDFKSGGELHVDGTIQGDISVKMLTIGKDAVIRGEISAEQVRVCGSVTGCIRAREVILLSTARVSGDVHHDVLSIETGALLEGHCRRREASKIEAVRDPDPVSTTGSEPLRLAPKPAEPTTPVAVAARPQPMAKAAGAAS